MVDVRPFRGLRYDPAVVGDVGRVLAPPYDVIDLDQESSLRELSQFNAVRLEYGAHVGDDPDRYSVASRTLAEWRWTGALSRDTDPAFYLIQHEFDHEGRRKTRTELMGAVRLSPWSEGLVLPHENTRSGPKRDRLELIRACRANLSPLMVLYSDNETKVLRLLNEARASDGPAMTTTAADGDAYRVSVIRGSMAEQISEALNSAGSLYVADGHHRYETALDYRAEVRAASSGEATDDGVDFVLASLIALEDEGLLSLPYHRLLRGLSPEAAGRFVRQMNVYFESEPVDVGSLDAAEVQAAFDRAASSNTGPVLAVLGREHLESMRVLRPLGDDVLTGLMSGRSRAWSTLSPCVFEDALLRPVLGMDQLEAENAGFLSYPRNAQEAIVAVRAGKQDYAVLLDGVPLLSMTEATEQGERLPPKSTYFYPKLPTGLVFNTLEGDI